MSSDTFDPATHSYYRDGARIPGVTEVLREAGMLTDHSRTDPFYAERGTLVHEAIALDLRGELDEESVDQEIRPYLESARMAYRQIDLTGGRYLVDWKSGAIEPGHRAQIAAYFYAVPALSPGRYYELQVYGDGYGGTVDMVEFGNITAARPQPLLVSLATNPPKLELVHNLRYHYDAFRGALCVYNWKRRERLA